MTRYDVAVVGAGVFGAWTAWHLRRAGKTVLLVDAWGAGHSRASSGGESRIIRMGYGPHEIYTRMAMRSLELWKSLFQSTGERLFHRTGVLWMGREDDPYSSATHETLERCGVSMEIISPSGLAHRYPQMRPPEGAYGIFEPGSGALMARRAVACVVQDAAKAGVEYRVRRVIEPEPDLARDVVFACGPWLPKLFPDLLRDRIQPTRQEIFFFAPPAGDLRFDAGNLPVWIDFADPRGPYGFPNLENRGVKLAFDLHGPEFDPDDMTRIVSPASVEAARKFLGERFPPLCNAPIAETRICQYENTSNGDFLIDRHPMHDNVWLVGGGSGHGFKHGPAVGEYVAQQILELGHPESRFSLATKGKVAERTVW